MVLDASKTASSRYTYEEWNSRTPVAAFMLACLMMMAGDKRERERQTSIKVDRNECRI